MPVSPTFHPDLSRVRVHEQALGAEGAAEAVSSSPDVLKSNAETIRGAMAALVATLGQTQASAAVGRNYSLLRIRPHTVRKAMAELTQRLGEAPAVAAVVRNPSLLTRFRSKAAVGVTLYRRRRKEHHPVDKEHHAVGATPLPPADHCQENP